MRARDTPHHRVEERNGRAIVFITVCTKFREKWLANEKVHQLLTEYWRDCSRWIVGRYLIMPDHLHLFATQAEDSCELDVWVRWWKSMLRRSLKTNSRWQRDYWDTTMRSFEHYYEKILYVDENPVRKGYVEKAHAWRFKGEIFDITWH